MILGILRQCCGGGGGGGGECSIFHHCLTDSFRLWLGNKKQLQDVSFALSPMKRITDNCFRTRSMSQFEKRDCIRQNCFGLLLCHVPLCLNPYRPWSQVQKASHATQVMSSLWILLTVYFQKYLPSGRVASFPMPHTWQNSS